MRIKKERRTNEALTKKREIVEIEEMREGMHGNV